MTYLAVLFSISFFIVGLKLFGVFSAVTKAARKTYSAQKIARHPNLSDRVKDLIRQRANDSLNRSLPSILGRVAGAAAVAVLPLLSLDLVGLVKVSEVTQLVASWPGMILSYSTMTATYLVTIRR